MELSTFLDVARRRRATRHFTDQPLPAGVLDQLLEAARWAPSGYNLQPTHFIVVTDPDRRTELRRACMDQPQITEAPAVVVFAGDVHVAKNHMEAVLALDKEAGAINDEYEALLRRYIPLAFGTGPAGLGWLFKALLLPPVSLVMRIPSLPAVYRRFWLAKQAGISAMSFMLAAAAAGLSTCPMEGFADRPVRKALDMPRHIVPLIIVPVGYSATPDAIKTRLPADRLVHREKW